MTPWPLLPLLHPPPPPSREARHPRFRRHTPRSPRRCSSRRSLGRTFTIRTTRTRSRHTGTCISRTWWTGRWPRSLRRAAAALVMVRAFTRRFFKSLWIALIDDVISSNLLSCWASSIGYSRCIQEILVYLEKVANMFSLYSVCRKNSTSIQEWNAWF